MEEKPKKRGRQPRSAKEIAAVPIEEEHTAEPDQTPVEPLKPRGGGGKRKAIVPESAPVVEKLQRKPAAKRGKAADPVEESNVVEENGASGEEAVKEKAVPAKKSRSTKKDAPEKASINGTVEEAKLKGKKVAAKKEKKETKAAKVTEEPVAAEETVEEQLSAAPAKRGRAKASTKKEEEPVPVAPPKPKGRGKAKDKTDVGDNVPQTKSAETKSTSAVEHTAKSAKTTARGKRKVAEDTVADIPTVTQRKRAKPQPPADQLEEEETAPSKEKKAKPAAAPKMNKCATDYESLNFALEEEKPWNFKISSWNVAGLRSWIGKGGFEFLEHEKPDILCLQETKCTEDQLPDEARHIKGYHPYWLCKPGGYAGVAIYSKKMPFHVTYGLGDEEQDQDGRILTAEYEKFYLVCVYVPNAGKKLVTLPKRLRWNEKFHQYLRDLDAKKPVILCGDMNVAHEEIDLANPKTNKKNAGFTQEERDGMTDLLSLGFVDTFRKLYPDRPGAYTFWTYMGGARAKNVGWRLDYFITSERLVSKVTDNVIRSKVFGSDHCPGRRTCLSCEAEFGIERSDFYTSFQNSDSYVYCPRCAKIYPGWDWEKVLAEHSDTPQHGGVQGEDYNGVYIDLDFLTTSEEVDLLEGLDELPWDISQSGRRKQNFGPKTNFKKTRLRPAQFAGFPQMSEFVQRRFEQVPLLATFQTIEQCSLEYCPERGASIDPHIDDCWIWGERIVTVNLLSDSVLTMSPYRGEEGKTKYNLHFLEQYREHLLGELVDEKAMAVNENRIVRIPMPRRSLLVLYGPPRYQWEHAVLREDIKERRVCLAYREFTPMYLQGGSEFSQSEEIFARAKQFWDHRTAKAES
uniref:exodeoxyribonuclease III n=1 Tax=Anopheles christyi TaxID=43041 RepID=A0A182K535_9DIPT